MSDELTDLGVRSLADAQTEMLGILVVSDDELDAGVIAERLNEAWPEVAITLGPSLEQPLEELTAQTACVILDLERRADQYDGGLETVRSVHEAEPDLPIVVLVENEAYGGAAIDAGAQDFLLKRRVDGSAIARAIRHSIQRARAEMLGRELALMRIQSAERSRVQRGLIPRFIVEDDRVQTRSGYRPGDRRQLLGGDFYDVIQSSPTRLQFALGDVAGHGPDEAALGVQLRIAWRTLVLSGVHQEQQLAVLDRLANQERHAAHVYATVATVEVDLDTGIGQVGVAGHPPPFLARDGGVQLLTESPGGPPLGLGLPPRWALDQIELGLNWTLLLYSDGLYEGRVAETGGRLEIDGLLELLRAGGTEAIWDATPDQLLDQVEALNEGPLEDDVALLAIRFASDRNTG